jgi:hypothetical protein
MLDLFEIVSRLDGHKKIVRAPAGICKEKGGETGTPMRNEKVPGYFSAED